MFISTAASPAAAGLQARPAPDDGARVGAGGQGGDFADFARQLDDEGATAGQTTDDDARAEPPASAPDTPLPDPPVAEEATGEGDEFARKAMIGAFPAGTTRGGGEVEAEGADARSKLAGEAASMTLPRTGHGSTANRVRADTPSGGERPKAVDDQTRRDGARNPASVPASTSLRDAQSERGGPFAMVSPGNAPHPAAPVHDGRIEVGTSRSSPRSPGPEAGQRALSPMPVTSEADKAQASTAEARLAPAASSMPVMPIWNPTNGLPHSRQDGSARFLSALSAVPAGESGAQPVIAGMESSAPARSMGASLDGMPGQAQESGRAAGRVLVDQILPALQRSAGGRVELTLSPVELGRVEITLQSRDGGMSVSLAAERPETLELLRRHIDLLAADMRQLGMTDLSFSFGRGSSGAPADEENQRQAGTDMTDMPEAGDRRAIPEPDADALPRRSDATAHIDLRL